MKRAFFKVPNKVFDIGLSATAVAIYAYLAKMPEDFNPSIGNMSNVLGISKPTVIKYMKELQNRNIIRCIQPGGENLITRYEFNKPEDWQ